MGSHVFEPALTIPAKEVAVPKIPLHQSLDSVVDPTDFIYHWDKADWQGAIFGSLSGIGYSSTLFLR
jgi:hypothetical protein